MTMIHECICLLINLLEGKDYYIDNTNYQRIFALHYMYIYIYIYYVKLKPF